VIPLFRQLRPESIYGAGFEPVILRWNSSLHAGRVSPYVELAGGGVRTNSNLPIGNTSDFNFTARGGGGILITRTPRHAIDVGVRWSHISDANLGVDHPEFNGIQVSVDISSQRARRWSMPWSRLQAASCATCMPCKSPKWLSFERSEGALSRIS